MYEWQGRRMERGWQRGYGCLKGTKEGLGGAWATNKGGIQAVVAGVEGWALAEEVDEVEAWPTVGVGTEVGSWSGV
jgi:hypothetical protein